jgi:uroporphyrinogen decarboxylase
MQNGLMFSPKLYREIVKPRQARLFGVVKSHAECKILYHTCGSNYEIIDDLIEIGVDALNPVQTDARNMGAEKLKKEFGDRLTFWGGIDTHATANGSGRHATACGIDTHATACGSGGHGPMEAEVLRVLGIMAPGGGYVLNPIHNIQHNVTAESICELFDSAVSADWRKP